ncbi:MAG: chemotaxis protein CheW [Herpetosiphonaceae bacterium]|nr:chemotaxis protein CheW [Herpetosiphonaceae bacterium]
MSASSAQFILFQLSTEWFVLPVEQIRGIERWRPPTPVPSTPPAIIGIINQRGALVTALDIRVLLGFKVEAPTRRTRFLLAHFNGVDLALVADYVADMLPLNLASIKIAPGGGSNLSSGLIQSPLGLASMLNLEAVLGMLAVAY